MRLVQVTDPTDTPVSVSDARLQCALGDETTHDTLLLRYIKAATKEIENYTQSILVERTMRLDLDGFYGRDIDLKTYPIQSITSIAYDDADDSAQTVSSADYWANLDGMTPFLRHKTIWPATYTSKLNSVRITFVAGYAEVDDIPEELKQAILVRVYEMWDKRESSHINLHLADAHRRISV